MNFDKYNIKIEPVSEEELQEHLERSKTDFNARTKDFIAEYARKLSEFAYFATAREYNGRICGLIGFYANTLPEAYISHVWVSSEMRGNGICGRLIQIIIDFCVSKKFKTISLEVRSNNLPAINAYKKTGFKIIATDDNKYKMTKVL